MVDRYPNHPGSKGADGTSQGAAAAIAPTVKHLRLTALRIIAELVTATPLEACAAAKLPRETLQPRFSELRAMGLLEPTGARRPNPTSGKMASVLRLTDKGRGVLHDRQAL